MLGKLLFAVVLTLILTRLDAQVSDAKVLRFRSINNIGLLTGSDKASLQLQSIAGVDYKNWFAGIGAGLENYGVRTLPVFFDLRHYFGETKNKWFVYGDAGTAVPVITASQKRDQVVTDKYSGKGYFDLGAGYRLSLGKKNAVQISAGYSRLNLKELVDPIRYTYALFSQNITYQYIAPLQYNYRLNRLSIKLGISF